TSSLVELSRVGLSPNSSLSFSSHCSLLPYFLTSLLLFSPRVPKQNHIAFLNDVLFSLQAHLRLFPRRSETPSRQQIVPPHHFRRSRFIHLSNPRFAPPATRSHRRIRPPLQSPQLVPLYSRIQLPRLFIAQIQHVQHRPLRQKQKSSNRFPLFRSQRQFPQRLLRLQMCFAFFQDGLLQLELLVGFLPQIFFQPLQPFIDLL